MSIIGSNRIVLCDTLRLSSYSKPKENKTYHQGTTISEEDYREYQSLLDRVYLSGSGKVYQEEGDLKIIAENSIPSASPEKKKSFSKLLKKHDVIIAGMSLLSVGIIGLDFVLFKLRK